MQYTLKCLPFNQLTADQIYDILQLRSDVFVIEQACIYQDIDTQDKESFHLWLEDKNHVIMAYLRIIPKGIAHDNVVIGRVVVHQDYRKHGLARIAMQSAFEWIIQNFGKEAIKIGAQTYLIDFYSSLGFTPISERYLEDDIEHIDMLKSA